MRFRLNLLAQGTAALLLILGTPVTLATKVLGTEEKSEAHKINATRTYTQRPSTNIQNTATLSQSNQKISPFYVNPSIPSHSDSTLPEKPLEYQFNSSKVSSVESKSKPEIALTGNNATPNHDSERESEPQPRSEPPLQRYFSLSNDAKSLKVTTSPRTQPLNAQTFSSESSQAIQKLPPLPALTAILEEGDLQLDKRQHDKAASIFTLSNGAKSLDVAVEVATSPQAQRSDTQTFSVKPKQDTQNLSTTPDLNKILEEGDRQLSERQYDKAATIFTEALHQAEATGNSLEIAKARSGQAAVELGSGRYAEAQNFSAQALVALRKANKKYPDVEADILLRQGYAYLGQEKKPDLENLVKQVTPIILELKESEKAAGLLVSLADLQYALGKKEAGNQSAQKAVSFLQKNPDPSGAIAVLSRLAVSQYGSEKSHEATKTLQRITDLIDKLNDQPKKVSLLQAVGELYVRLGETEGETAKARQSFENARQVFEKLYWLPNLQNSKTEANVRGLLGFGRAYLGLNRNEEAVEQAQQALKIIEELEKSSGAAKPEKKRRSLFDQLDRIACDVERVFSRSSTCDEEAEDAELAALNQADTILKRTKRDARDVIAAARLNQERYAESDASLRDALQITREIDNRLSNLAKTIRQIQGISGIISVLPLGFVSEFGSYVNTTAASFDQIIALPQGGASLLAKINTDMINSSKKRSLDDLKQQQKEAHSQQNSKAEAEILLQLGSGYLGIGKYSDAGRAFKEAATLFRQLNQPNQEAWALLGSGRSLYLERNYSDAQMTTQQAADIFRRESDSLGSANTWLTFGNISLSRSKFSQAKEQLQKALDIFSEAKEDKDAQIGKANTLLALGTVALRQRKYRNALQNAEAAIGIFQSLRNETESARARLVRGSAYQALGNHRKALEDARKALFIFKDRGDRLGEISALNNIGDALQSQSRYEQAIKFYGLSAELQKDLQKYIQKPKSKTGLLVTIFRVSSFFLPWVGTLGQAGLKIYNALSVAQSVVYLSESSIGGIGSGVSYLNLGDYDQAMQTFNQVRKASKNQDPQKEAEALLGLSNTRLSFNRDYEMARKDADRAVVLFNGIGDRVGVAYALLAQGISYNRLGKSQPDSQKRTEYFSKALAAFQQAISTFQDPEILDSGGEAQAYSALADLLANQNRGSAAISFYKKSIQISERIRQETPDGQLRTAYIGNIADTYRRLVEFLLSQERLLEAQQVLELLKVQEIDRVDPEIRATLKFSRIEYTALEKEINLQHGNLVDLGQKLYDCETGRSSCSAADREKWTIQRGQLQKQFDQTLEAAEVQARNRIRQSEIAGKEDFIKSYQSIVEAQPGTLLVYPFVTENKIWLLWASKGGVLSSTEVPNVGRQQLFNAVKELRNNLEEKPNSDPANLQKLQQTSQQLYQWLIKPLEPALLSQNIKHLVFSLDSTTRYIPMSVLFDGKQYLIERYTVSTVLNASLTDTSDLLPKSSQKTPILALGVSQGFPNFPPLNNVPIELDAIVKSPGSPKGIYPGEKLLNADFNERAFNNYLNGQKIVHIATHADFLPTDPKSSYLLLGNGRPYRIREIQFLRNLNKVHLVVLSACKTALSETNPDGKEILGISAYFTGGSSKAKAVLASLWKVNDSSTSLLMQRFYQNLATGKLTKAEALQQAQRSLLESNNPGNQNGTTNRSSVQWQHGQNAGSISRDLRHPYYWAPFILIGNGL